MSARAEAHASLIASEPPDGLVLAEAPREVALTFDEPTELIQLRLTRPDGRSGDAAVGAGRRAVHRATLPPADLGGTYVLSWRAASQDGHPVGGATTFSVGHASAEPDAASLGGTSLPVAAGLWLARLAVALGTAFGVGGAAFLTLVTGQVARLGGVRAFVGGALWLGGLGAVAGVGFQGLDLLGRDLAALADPGSWWAGLARTPQGATAVLAGLAFALAGAGLAGRSGPLALAALATSAAAFAASGHTVTAAPRWVTQPAVFLHALAMTVWIGALAPLAGLARAGGPALAGPLKRFSDLIPFGLAALLSSGLALAIVQLGTPAALWRTAYGQVFLGKLALLAMVLALAAVNRLVLTAPASGAGSGADAARRRLVLSVAAESALGVGILGAAGLWRFTTPPRLLPAPAADAVVALASGPYRATVLARPARVGGVRLLVVEVLDGERAVTPTELTITVEKPSFGLGPFRKTVRRGAEGSYAPVDLFLPMDGLWIVRLDMLIDEFRQATLRDVLDVAPAGQRTLRSHETGLRSG